jgi:DNA-binding IclR family transcriptional regulator
MQRGIMKSSLTLRMKASKIKKSHPDYSVPALDKGLDVFEVLAASNTALSLTELAAELGQTPSAVFRILNRLEGRSYVVRDAVSGRYSLSLKLFELAHTHSPVEHIITISGKPMRELARSVRESAHLSVLSHSRLVVLLDIGSPLRVRFAHEIGAQFSPVLTNSGRLLLAYLPTEDLENHLKIDPDYKHLAPAKRQTFHDELKKIRRNGYAISNSQDWAGMKDLAVLAGNPVVGITAALAISCLSAGKSSADIKSLLAALHECAGKITNTMGVSYDRSPAI